MAQASTEPVRTFTVGFGDERYDERRYARAVAERWSTRHEEIVLEPDAAATLPRLAAAFDEPLGDEAALPLFLICEAARREVTVALVGDGGDESFAGYERYAAMGLADRVPAALRPRPARGCCARCPGARGERRSTLHRAARFLDAAAAPRAERYGGLMQVFSLDERASLWTDDAKDGDRRRSPRPGFLLGPPPADGHRRPPAARPRDLPARRPAARSPTSHRWRTRSSCGRRSSTIASSSSGCRCRPSLKQQGRAGQGRASARVRRRPAAGRRRTREDRLRRPARALVPRGPASARARRCCSTSVRARAAGSSRERVERLLDDHAAARADNGHRLWTLTMLELWQRTHVDAAALAPPALTT